MPARRTTVPADLRAFVPFDRIDYADAFRVPPTRGGHSAETWLRSFFDDSPSLMTKLARGAWLTMGAQLAPRGTPDHLFGCPFDSEDRDLARMAVTWRIGLRATIVARAGEDDAVVATFVRLDTRASRVAWRTLSPVHRTLMAVGLSLTARRLGRVATA